MELDIERALAEIRAAADYPEAHHGFFNDTRPHIYNAEAAQDAWQRTLDWFGRYLTG